MKGLRRKAGSFQRTFKTALDRLPTFVPIILGGVPSLRSAALNVEAIVFPPKQLEELLAHHRLPVDALFDSTVTADDPSECEQLLLAALGDWADFFYLPEPKRFLIYADHDEYITLFASRKGSLSQIAADLLAAGFTEVVDYVREF